MAVKKATVRTSESSWVIQYFELLVLLLSVLHCTGISCSSVLTILLYKQLMELPEFLDELPDTAGGNGQIPAALVTLCSIQFYGPFS